MKYSVRARTYFAPVAFARVTGPMMSAATVWKRIPVSKVCRSAFRRFPPLVRAAHSKQTCSLHSTSNRTLGHQNRCLTRPRVFSRWKCPPLTGDACNSSWTSWSRISFLQRPGTKNCKRSPSTFSFLRYRSPSFMRSSSQWDQYASTSSPYLVASALVNRLVLKLERSLLLPSCTQ